MFKYMFILLLTTVVECQVSPSVSSPNAPTILCELCNTGLSLVQTQLTVLESITQNNLGSLINKVCQAAPTDIPIVKALCTVLQENLVNALVTLIQGFKDQTSPRLLCGYMNACDKNVQF
ncbi:hypothetical protein CRE_31144 [Caenorhabditis remanei]|uniref:Saposin B-type domain-containing protein n=1 Tax=Caenorhabditis remanei TaxID=31234 RepID=E3LUV5_CAERE|nr:hypothetical protein CRE_31144 [Caenorhabditis remanei]